MLLCCRVKDGPRLAPYAAYHTLLLGTYVQERSLSNLPGIRVGWMLDGAEAASTRLIVSDVPIPRVPAFQLHETVSPLSLSLNIFSIFIAEYYRNTQI